MCRILGMTSLLLLCAGLTACDGFYIYRYEGQLLQESSGVPAKNVSVCVGPSKQIAPNTYVPELITPPKCNSPEQTQITSSDGRFAGAFWTRTAWATVFRPPPPKLHKVYLSYEWNGQWRIQEYAENEFEQLVVKSKQGLAEERVIRLPPLIISSTLPH